VVPVDGGHRQTTCALYPAGLRSAAEDLLRARGSLWRLLADRECVEITPDEWREWGEDGRSWFSVDSRRALRLGLDRYGPPAS
jgi:molybdopterin-guanine dinucleotide biosynthesis protein A